MNLETFRKQLCALKLNAAAESVTQILAEEKRAVSLDWASRMLEAEIDARKEKSLQSRIRRAEFPAITTLEGFDWGFNKDIDKNRIMGISRLDFLRENRICLFLGKPGTGKTHLALAIGILAARAGYRVRCTGIKRLARQIIKAKISGNLDILFKKYLACQLWIIDDWGVVSLDREIAEEIFDLFDRRKHSSAMILTSNRDIDEWPSVFPDSVLASATIDRLFEEAEIVLFRGNSYRLKGKIQMKEIEFDVSKRSRKD